MRTKLSQFKFELNEKLIAKTPSKRRDDSRMMVVNRETGEIEHKMFKDLLDFYEEGDSLVFNNTKVFPKASSVCWRIRSIFGLRCFTMTICVQFVIRVPHISLENIPLKEKWYNDNEFQKKCQ